MANTQGFDVVAELREAALKALLKAAWKSGGDTSAEGVIPEKIDIPGPSVPAPVNFGPYQVSKGHIQIPQEELDLTMDTAINGMRIKLGTIIHIEIANPPIDSAKLFDMTADIFVRTPLRGRNNDEIIADFTALPANAVTVNITSGDPIGPVTNAALEEYVHKKYQDNTIPHAIDNIPISFLVFNMKCRIDFYDDVNNPALKIKVEKPDPTHVKLKIPCHLRFYDITGSYLGFSLATPMGIDAVAEMTADYTETPGNILVKISTATVDLTNLTPAAGIEGTNYTSNKNVATIAGQDLDNLIINGFKANATAQLRALGDISVNIPTLQQIQTFAETAVRNELLHRKQIQIWKVEEVPDAETPIENVTPQALADCLAIAINDRGGGSVNALVNFIPAGRDFAIATSAQKVRQIFDKKKNEKYPELQHGNSHTFSQPIEGKTVRLNSLGMELHNGHIEINGDITIVDAVLDSIDVDAGFAQNVTLDWNPNAAAGQKIQHHLQGDPDVDLGAAAWILTAIIGLLTFGVVGLIIGLIIVAIVENIASQIGGEVAADEADKFDNAWPVILEKIGNIEAHFHNPIIIETTGLVFTGNMVFTSTHALTSMDMARSHGPYAVAGNALVNFNGGVAKPTSIAKWHLGNGQIQNARNFGYRYGKSGLYIAHVTIKVNETGGVTTEHYTRVRVKNVVPVIIFENPVITITEGQEIEIKASFTDDNWLDKHKAWFDFGDNTAPTDGTLTETNNEPQCKGTVSVKHAWCDDGDYTVTLFIQDDVGGLGKATMTVHVTNVPPKIIAPKKICVLRHQPVRLEAIFTDPGWCDTHIATWDTGDGHIKMATIHELHRPPELLGYASASHIYTCIGNYVASVTVSDDEGGEDKAIILVTVTELRNANFEDGFRIKLKKSKLVAPVGNPSLVANEWLPFIQPLQLNAEVNTGAGALDVGYDVDEFINRNGQRSQLVKVSGSGMTGIRQTLCANKNWDYEFTTYYHLPSATQSKLIIGIDAAGGTDPANMDIQWLLAPPSDEWVHASVRVKALADRITCFTGILQENGSATLFIDKCALFMIQPVYGSVQERKKKREQTYVPEAVETYDFRKLESYYGMKEYGYQEAGSKAFITPDVRFSTFEEQAPLPRRKQESKSKMTEVVIKSVAHIGGSIAKNIVVGTLHTLLPFLKKKKE